GLAGRGAVLGRLAVRDAADPDDPRRPAGGPRRRGARRARGRTPGPDPSLRRAVRPAVPVFDGMAPGAVRRAVSRGVAGPRALLSAVAARQRPQVHGRLRAPGGAAAR